LSQPPHEGQITRWSWQSTCRGGPSHKPARRRKDRYRSCPTAVVGQSMIRTLQGDRFCRASPEWERRQASFLCLRDSGREQRVSPARPGIQVLCSNSSAKLKTRFVVWEQDGSLSANKKGRYPPRGRTCLCSPNTTRISRSTFVPIQIDEIPTSLLPARVDGCVPFRFLWRVVLPLCRPALGTLGVITFVTSRNDFLQPLIILTKEC
jgi:hypothetical protein